MIILAHRGLWETPVDKNTRAALRRALAEGFGIETDIRDFDGRLVISHDPPRAEAMHLDDFLDDYVQSGGLGLLALNIKADGLQPALAEALADRRIGPDRYFVFDMAVPDALGSTANYLKMAGWVSGANWGYEVQLPKGYAGATGRTARQPLVQFTKLGVKPIQADQAVPSETTQAALLLPAASMTVTTGV